MESLESVPKESAAELVAPPIVAQPVNPIPQPEVAEQTAVLPLVPLAAEPESTAIPQAEQPVASAKEIVSRRGALNDAELSDLAVSLHKERSES